MLAFSHHVYDTAWGIIVGFFLVGFAFFETAAFIGRKPDEDTLSAHVWKMIGTRRGWYGWNIPMRIGTLALFLWLAEHFTFGWF